MPQGRLGQPRAFEIHASELLAPVHTAILVKKDYSLVSVIQHLLYCCLSFVRSPLSPNTEQASLAIKITFQSYKIPLYHPTSPCLPLLLLADSAYLNMYT